MAKISTFDDWTDYFRQWQKDIGFETSTFDDYKNTAVTDQASARRANATFDDADSKATLANILMPSASIAQGYEAYVVETFHSGILDGVLGPQSPATVTLRHEDGKEDVIQRQDIKNMYVANLSAMPGDLEKQVNVQQMTDLLEYLKTVR